MGRKPHKNLNLPARVRARTQKSGKVWYYLDLGGKPRREIPLGCDYLEMLRKYAELERDRSAPAIMFRDVAMRYQIEVIPTKAPRTQRDNVKEIARLIDYFDGAELDDITPQHVYQYMDWRKAPVRANREKALLSHIFTKALRWGYTARPNPCTGVEANTESGRDVYVEDAEYQVVWAAADPTTRDLMDLIYLTGQRPGDVLRMQETDIQDGVLLVQQGKTGKRLRISVTGELEKVIGRILTRKASYKVRSLRLIVDEQGRALALKSMNDRFTRARTNAGASFQLRDLRAKAATDVEAGRAQKLLGHSSVTMTEHYIRNRKGDKVEPTK